MIACFLEVGGAWELEVQVSQTLRIGTYILNEWIILKTSHDLFGLLDSQGISFMFSSVYMVIYMFLFFLLQITFSKF